MTVSRRTPCAATLADQPATGPDAAARLAEEVSGSVLVAIRDTDDDAMLRELEAKAAANVVADLKRN
mgnify:CR=1 FL=1